MRRLFVFIVLAVAGIYAVGHLALSESGVNALLAQIEEKAARADVDGVCALFDEHASISLDDRTPEGPMKLTGGKPELCAYLSQVLPLQLKMVTDTQIRRDDLKIQRDRSHPWSARVAYNEHRTVKFAPGPLGIAQSQMRSHDEMTVVSTLAGRKITRLNSVSSASSGPQI